MSKTAAKSLHNTCTPKDVKIWTENDPCLGKSTSGFGPARRHVQMRQRLGMYWDDVTGVMKHFQQLTSEEAQEKRADQKNTENLYIIDVLA